MGDAQATLLPPPSGVYTPMTPSGLTPNTRSEAEAALTHNTTAQTDSAAPTTPIPTTSSTAQHMYPGMGVDGSGGHAPPPGMNTYGNGNARGGGSSSSSNVTEAQQAYRRPVGPIRTSSTNYEKALREAHMQTSASSDLPPDSAVSGDILGQPRVESPVQATVPFPLPGQGVVPQAYHKAIGNGQAEVVKKARPSGLSLGDLGRRQSWSEQDMRHVLQARLMSPIKGDAGYDSGPEGRAVGHS